MNLMMEGDEGGGGVGGDIDAVVVVSHNGDGGLAMD
jgi:hypothetical protein